MRAFDKKFLILLLAIAGWLVIPGLIPQVHAAGYSILVIPNRTQESDSPGVLLAINVTGATIGTNYKFTFQVTDPSGSVKQATNQTAAGGATSTSFVLSVNYPNGPGFGTHLNYVGNYTINVQQNNPTNIPSVARGNFLVGLTDKVSYQRTFTVSIVARGYNNNSPVNIDIAQGGSSAPGYPKTLTTTSTGTLSTTWVIPASLRPGTWTVSLTGSPVKTAADIQPFTVYPTNVTISQLNLNQTSLERTRNQSFSFTASYLSGSPAQTGGTGIRVTESDGTTSFHIAANYSTTLGAYFATYKVQTNDQVGSWTATIDPNSFDDGYGNGGPVASIVRGFTVYQTNVTISRLNLSKTVMTRTETESFSFTASYLNGAIVTTGGALIELTESDGTTSFLITANYSSSIGAYVANYRIRPQDQTGSWVAVIDPAAFNDGYGNGGPMATVVRGFTVQPASLSVALSISNQTFAVGEGVPIYARVTYPDGSAFTNGTVMVTLSSKGSDFKSSIPLTYIPAKDSWATVYTVTSIDPSGLWLARVDASDSYANAGTQTGSVVVSVPPPTPTQAQNGPFTTSTFAILAGIVGAAALLGVLILRRKAKGTSMKLDLTVVDNEVDKIKGGEFYQNIKKQMEEAEHAEVSKPPSGTGDEDNPTPESRSLSPQRD